MAKKKKAQDKNDKKIITATTVPPDLRAARPQGLLSRLPGLAASGDEAWQPALRLCFPIQFPFPGKFNRCNLEASPAPASMASRSLSPLALQESNSLPQEARVNAADLEGGVPHVVGVQEMPRGIKLQHRQLLILV